MRRFLLAAALAIPLLAGAAASTTTQAAPLPQAATCSGVWVVVDYGSLGGTSTKCATSYSNGAAALKSAGFSATFDNGFLLKINGKPSSPDPNTAYWSYWHATPKDDGTWSSWSYSTLGADSYHPTKGNAEGWHYQKLSDGKVAPSVAPPVADTGTPTPTPTATKTTSKPTATATKTKTASASATPTKTKTASATPTATPPASEASQASSGTPVATSATPLGADQATEVPSEQVSGVPQDTGSGSPVGLFAAGAVIVLAGGGLGGWWLMKGRRP